MKRLFELSLVLGAVLFVMGCGSETTVVVDGDGDAASQADGDADSGTCSSDSCAIDGVCYADKAASPTSSCRRCEVATSRTAWTNVAYGTSCNDGNACTKNDACDGQGTCQGEADSACQADGDADYDTDIDPDEVVIGGDCPEQGLRFCLDQVVVGCNDRHQWYVSANCAAYENRECWNAECIDPSTSGYPGCTWRECRCVGNLNQCCTPEHQWTVGADCSVDGGTCQINTCVNP